MPRTFVVRDPAHPGYPHGTTVGYNRGCGASSPCPATPTCQQARTQRDRQVHLARANGTPEAAYTVPAGPVVEHVEQLLTLPRARLTHLAALAGVSTMTMTRIAKGRQAVILRRTADAITAVSRDRFASHIASVDAAGSFVDAGPFHAQSRALQARGYPLCWQEGMIGARIPRDAGRVHRDHAAALDDLGRRIGGSVASPGDYGLSAAAINAAVRHARRCGFGLNDEESRAAARRDSNAKARARFAVLHALVTGHEPTKAAVMAQHAPMYSEDALGRWLSALGLHLESVRYRGRTWAAIVPEHVGLAAVIRRHAYAIAQDPDSDAIAAWKQLKLAAKAWHAERARKDQRRRDRAEQIDSAARSQVSPRSSWRAA